MKIFFILLPLLFSISFYAQDAELLKKIKKDCSIIVVEHDMQFAKDVSDTVTVFHEGQVLDEGTMESVQKNQKVIDVYLGRG